jgi:hypothetical protein
MSFYREPFLVVGVGTDPDCAGVGVWTDPETQVIYSENVRVYFNLASGFDQAVRTGERTVLLVDGQGLGHIVPSRHYLADVTVENLLLVEGVFSVGYLGSAPNDAGDYTEIAGRRYTCSPENKAPIGSHLVIAH